MENLRNSVTNEEQRAFIKISTLLGQDSKAIRKKLNDAIGTRAYSLRNIQIWVKAFKEGRNKIIDEERSGRPKVNTYEERIQKVKKLLTESRAYTVSLISCRLILPRTSIYRILTEELQLVKKLGKWIPHKLTEEQKQLRVALSKLNMDIWQKNNNTLKRTLAIDETWVSLSGAPTKDQAKYWIAPHEELPEIVSDNIYESKRMLILAMDFDGIAFWKLMDEKETVNSEKYLHFLKEYLPKWLSVKSFLKPILLHDNARPHKAWVVKDFIQKQGWSVWEHPPYSPDLNPCDYNCFAPLKRELKKNSYENWNQFSEALINAIQRGSQKGLFQGVEKLSDCWKRVIDKSGGYI
jgi:histone-lysine N-methyltransferase SETMAR